MKTKRKQVKMVTSMRLSEKARRLLAEMAEQLGVTSGAVLELAIREKARRLGVK